MSVTFCKEHTVLINSYLCSKLVILFFRFVFFILFHFPWSPPFLHWVRLLYLFLSCSSSGPCSVCYWCRGQRFSRSNVTSESNLESFSLWWNCDLNVDTSAVLNEWDKWIFLKLLKKTAASAWFQIFLFFLNFPGALLEFTSNGCAGLISTFFRIFFVHI